MYNKLEKKIGPRKHVKGSVLNGALETFTVSSYVLMCAFVQWHVTSLLVVTWQRFHEDRGNAVATVSVYLWVLLSNFSNLAYLSPPEVVLSGYYYRISQRDVMTLLDVVFPYSHEGSLYVFVFFDSGPYSYPLVLPTYVC